MSDKPEDEKLSGGFYHKSDKNSDPMTLQERQEKGAEVMRALDNAAQQAQENGLTEDILNEILDEYYDEKYGEDRVNKDG